MARQKFKAFLAPEGSLTDDGRVIEKGALNLGVGNLPLLFQRQLSAAHDGGAAVGVITRRWREGSKVMGEGYFLDVDDLAEMDPTRLDVMAAQRVAAAGIGGVSLDLSRVSMKLRVKESFFEGRPVEKPKGGFITLMERAFDDVQPTFTRANVKAATMVSKPAFANANVSLTASGGVDAEHPCFVLVDDDGQIVSDTPALIASATPLELDAIEDDDEDVEDSQYEADPSDDVCPCSLSAAGPPTGLSQSAFAKRSYDTQTRLTVKDGMVFGHVAPDRCHIGSEKVCIRPPKSQMGYRPFHQHVLTAGGVDLAVGALTVGGGHADDDVGFRAAMEHYDNVGTVWAYVRAYDDEHGVQVAGVLADGVDEEKVRLAMSAPVSGDWREIDGALELVAVCSVVVPGFLVVTDDDDRQVALIASGPPPLVESDTDVVEAVETTAQIDMPSSELAALIRDTAREVFAEQAAAQTADAEWQLLEQASIEALNAEFEALASDVA